MIVTSFALFGILINVTLFLKLLSRCTVANRINCYITVFCRSMKLIQLIKTCAKLLYTVCICELSIVMIIRSACFARLNSCPACSS